MVHRSCVCAAAAKRKLEVDIADISPYGRINLSRGGIGRGALSAVRQPKGERATAAGVL